MDPDTGELMVAPSRETWTDIEKIQYEAYEKYKQSEYEIYKAFHSTVLVDDGIPALKKTAFKMPGYKKIIGQKMDEFVIDNEIVDRKFAESKLTHSS